MRRKIRYGMVGGGEGAFIGAVHRTASARFASRLPSGHLEGYIEAFANIYRNFAEHIRARDAGAERSAASFVPGIAEALRGMAFIETVVAASASNTRWHAFPEVGA
jgi:hypothetical protein